MKRIDGQCSVCVPLSLSDQWLCNNWVNATLYLWSGRAESFRLVSHIHVCASELGAGNGISIGLANGWLPVRHQAITQSYPGIFSIVHLGINFSEIRIKFKSLPLPTYLRVWLHVYIWLTTRRQSGATGGAWNSLDTTEQTPLWYIITLGSAVTEAKYPGFLFVLNT